MGVKGAIKMSNEMNQKTEETLKEATKNLLSAARNADVEEVARLMQKGADVNAADIFGRTPLMYAFIYAIVNKQNPGIIRALLDNEADVNVADNNGCTPLMYALVNAIVNRQNPDVIRALLDNGADVNATGDPL